MKFSALLLLFLASSAFATTTDDSFVDAGAPLCLESHTPTGGGSWTYRSGTVCASGTSGVAVNVSGQLRSYSAGPTHYSAASTSTTDQIITVTVGATNSIEGWFWMLADSTSAISGVALDIVCAGTSYMGDMSAGSFVAGYKSSTGAVTCAAGDVFKFIGSGGIYKAQRCPGGTSCADIAGLTGFTSARTLTTNIGIVARSVQTNAITHFTSDDYSSNTISLPALGPLSTQVLPYANGTTSATATASGTYTGTAPSNIDIQFYQSDGTTVVNVNGNAWNTMSGCTIGGGTYSTCTISLPSNFSGSIYTLRWQVRETNNTAILSGVSTNLVCAGDTMLRIGQSQFQHMWNVRGQLADATYVSGTAVATGTWDSGIFPIGNWLIGLPVFGPDIPADTTITAQNGITQITLSNNFTGSATATGVINVSFSLPSVNTGAYRFQGVSFITPSAGHQTSEFDAATIGNADGARTFTNLMSANVGVNSLGGCAADIQYAIGSTSISYWISSGGAGYTASVNGLKTMGGDISSAAFAQGGTDALALRQTVTGTANNGSGLIRITVGSTYLWTTGDTAIVASVGGTTEANGTWTITVIDATHVDLQGSAFTNAWTSGGTISVTTNTVYLAGLRNVVAWTRVQRANVPFFIVPLGWLGDGTADAQVETIRQAHLTSIDNDTNVFWGGGEVDLPHWDSYHLTPAGRYTLNRRLVQARMRQLGLSASGYGPKIANVTWDGAKTITVNITQEAGTALKGKNQGSCVSLTGFRAFSNGSGATISTTSCPTASTIRLVASANLTAPVTLDYQYGTAPTITNPVYDDQPPLGDADGLPLQPSRGALTATLVANQGAFFMAESQ